MSFYLKYIFLCTGCGNHPRAGGEKIDGINGARLEEKNRKEQIELLSELLTIINDHGLGPSMATKIKFAIVAALFDYNPKLLDAMKLDSWEKCMAGVDSLLDMMEEHETVVTTGELIMEENGCWTPSPTRSEGVISPPWSAWIRSSSR
jgi:translation initiation factor 3 subunit C